MSTAEINDNQVEPLHNLVIIVGSEHRRWNEEERSDEHCDESEAGEGMNGGPHRDRRRMDLDLTAIAQKEGNIMGNWRSFNVRSV